MKDLPPHSEYKLSEENIPEYDSAFVNKTQMPNRTKYIIDSGCASHVVSTKVNFTYFTPGNFGEITIANGKKLKSQCPANVKLKIDTQHYVTLKNVLYFPDLQSNLLSVNKATENDIEIIFDKQSCSFVKDNNIILTARRNDILYQLKRKDDCGYSIRTQSQIYYNNKKCIPKWPNKLGLKNFDAFRSPIKNRLGEDIQNNNCKHETICAKYPKAAINRSKEVLT